MGLWPLGYHLADDSSPLMLKDDPLLLDALKAGLNNALKTYAIVWLPLLKKSFTEVLCDEDSTSMWNSSLRHVSNNKSLQLSDDDFTSFNNRYVSSKTKKTMRYYLRKFAEMGDISYKLYRSTEELTAFFPQIKWVERQSWKHNERTGLFAIDGSREFYSQLLTSLAEKGLVEVDAIFVGEECAAYQLGFIRPGYYAMHNSSYSRAYSDLSPGLHLQLHVFERLFNSDVAFFDFLQGNQSYKDRYKPDIEALMEATLFARTWRGRLNNIVLSTIRKLRRKSYLPERDK